MKTFLSIVALLLAVGLASCGKPASSNQTRGDSTATASAEYYTCPMHPQVHSDKPGVCPICHMDLVKASNSRQAAGPADAAIVQVSDRSQVLANVSTVVVGRETIGSVVRAFGTLEIPEPNKVTISARFNGRIEKLHVNAVGERVAKGEPLFDVYSPDLIQAETEYRQARSAGVSRLLETAKAKLLLLGLTEGQIRDLETAETVPLVTTFRSPAAGVVIEKKIVEGLYVSEGMALYDISDLSTLWDLAEVYESDAASLKAGDRATFTTPGVPAKTFSAKVGFVYPVVDPETRTVKVRLVVNNGAGTLRPNMFTETSFMRMREGVLAVPVGAVLMTGKRNLVYVKAGHENHFEAREVGLGLKSADKYEITWGLTEGEEVVSEGGYLIDSESQLKTGGREEHQNKTEGGMEGMKM